MDDRTMWRDSFEERALTMRIDSHIHLWDLSVYKRRDWLQDKPQLIRNFLPADAVREFDLCGITHGIVVEAAKHSLQDNIEWLKMTDRSPRLLGAVPGCYLEDPELDALLDEFAQWDSFVGVRATPNRESNSFYDLTTIQGGLETLSSRGITFEILATAEELEQVARIAARFSALRIVVDHCGLPTAESVRSGVWAAGVASLVDKPNVFVKYSGLAMIGKGLRDGSFFRTVADTLFQKLGSARLIWGSNWPVDSLWSPYDADWEFSRRLLPERLDEAARRQVFSQNALRAYGLDSRVKGNGE